MFTIKLKIEDHYNIINIFLYIIIKIQSIIKTDIKNH